MLCFCAVPSSPKNVAVERVNGSHMVVNWSVLTPVEARGYITHYTVYYWLASNSTFIMNAVVPQNVTRVVIGSLLHSKIYNIQLSASTSVGEGRLSDEVSSTILRPCQSTYIHNDSCVC